MFSLIPALALFASPPAQAIDALQVINYSTVDATAVVERGNLDLEIDGQLLSDWGDALVVVSPDDGPVELSIADTTDEDGLTWTIAVTAWEGRSSFDWERGRGEVWTTVEGELTWDLVVVATAADGTKIKYGPVITIKPKG